MKTRSIEVTCLKCGRKHFYDRAHPRVSRMEIRLCEECEPGLPDTAYSYRIIGVCYDDKGHRVTNVKWE